MTDSSTVYRAVLKPAGTSLVDATDVRLLDLTLTPTNTSLYEAAIDRIRDTECIDTYAFENHWELYYVHRRDTSDATQLRDALHAVPYTLSQWPSGYLSFDLELLDDQTHHWHSTCIGIQDHTMKNYNRWRHELAVGTADIDDREEKYMHEAMLHAVAELTDDFAHRVFTDPIEAHDSFVTLATNNSDTVLSHLQ